MNIEQALKVQGLRGKQEMLHSDFLCLLRTLPSHTGSGSNYAFFSKIVKYSFKRKHIHCTFHLKSLESAAGR